MTTPPEDDNWVNSALTDTDLVVHLLVNLRSSPPSPPKTWTIRQPRSKPPPPPTKSQPTRASPTTPLSYSGATTSVSAGLEESSRLLHSDGSRSKVCCCKLVCYYIVVLLRFCVVSAGFVICCLYGGAWVGVFSQFYFIWFSCLFFKTFF
ncbi:hypothetical protein HanOQP8_Chr02g0041491 [Helianthus annuus]|nr:hypothetical protein HanOQP8_Chr02g0041491 [Helianthus annuus]